MKRISLLVLSSIFTFALSAQAKDLGFRYKNGKCVNEAGAEGLNPSFIGQCADWQGVVLSRAVLDDVDFSGGVFDGADLNNSSFKSVNFTGARFVSSVLDGTDMSGAIIHDVNMSGASLVNAHLSDADFNKVDFSNANFKGAKLSYLSFPNCKFMGANFQGAAMDNLDLRNSDFSGTDFSGADLSGSDLSGAVLKGAKASQVNLIGSKLVKVQAANVDLRRAVLRDADLSGAVLSGGKFNAAQMDRVNLKNGDLSNGDLRGTVLTGANLEGTKLTGAKYSKRTQLPITQKEADKRGMMMAAGTVLLLWDLNAEDAQITNAKTKLEAAGLEVELSKQGRAAFDGTMDLSNYSAIFQLYDHSDTMEVAGQVALVNFVKAGGTYVGSGMISHFVDSHGQLESMADLVLLVEATFNTDDVTIAATQGNEANPLLDGVIDQKVNASYIGATELRTFAQDPAKAVAVRKEDGTSPVIATRKLGAGTVVQIAFNMSGTNDYPDLQQDMVSRIVINALDSAGP